MKRYQNERNFLKSNFDVFSNKNTDKYLGIPKPPEMKSYNEKSTIVDLPNTFDSVIKKQSIVECIKNRRSNRIYSDEALNINELSYLLWATQGITGITKGGLTLRTVPCSGATHSFETYLFIMNVDGLTAGLYRYLPMEHKLLFLYPIDDIDNKVDEITLEQPFVPNFARKAAVLFVWSTIPYRSEWKFDITAHKKILIDVGHVCQNLYLASESIDAGTCAIGIYDQKMIDEILELDGEDEFVIYLAAVGKKQ